MVWAWNRRSRDDGGGASAPETRLHRGRARAEGRLLRAAQHECEAKNASPLVPARGRSAEPGRWPSRQKVQRPKIGRAAGSITPRQATFMTLCSPLIDQQNLRDRNGPFRRFCPISGIDVAARAFSPACYRHFLTSSDVLRHPANKPQLVHVIPRRKHKQTQQQREAGAETVFLRPRRDRPSADRLREIE